ncbi:hypothetical protein SELMODRAFT_420115 [Selaginella moellendorffii]|uniref:Protein kinase domain-containing protein n=1 Tax=Selaginella moellendorffii TaxID=88036 RepID=D8SB07_SELML|nr:hypothetical protein SELMODRAFT_420115 [Selaginella moellendorffii]
MEASELSNVDGELQAWKPYDAELARSWESINRQLAWAQSIAAEVIREKGFEKFKEVTDGITAYRKTLVEDHLEFTKRKELDYEQKRLSLCPLKKRRLPEASLLRNSSIVSVNFEDCKEKVIWKDNIPRQIVGVDELLESPRHLVAELRWLHFLLYEAKETDLTDVLNMRKGRSKTQNDKELEYHPLLFKFMEASSGGQPEVKFLREVHVGGAREDLSSSILGGKFNEAHEVKAAFSLAVSGKPETGIERNVAGISKMYKSNKKYAGLPCHLGIFATRCEYVWFVKFRYEQRGEAVVSCEVAPEFPCGPGWEMSNVLCDLALLNTAKEGSKLIDICPSEPNNGFHLLVRYVDTLCTLYSIPKAPLELARNDGSKSIDLSTASIVGQGYKSVVFKLPGEDCVIKVSDRSRIGRETFIHERVDGTSFTRPQRKGLRWCGQVLGAGDGLEWMVLAGFGRPVTSDNVLWDFQGCWNQASAALVGLHSRGVLHRDIKPSNMLIFHDELWLNDFDCSCLVDESVEIRRMRVGAPYFESPLFDGAEGFLYRDDWYSLVLTFLDLLGWYGGGADKNSTLSAAVRNETFPASFKACINWLLADGDGLFRVELMEGGQNSEETKIKIKTKTK